jgi:hypothetical protein
MYPYQYQFVTDPVHNQYEKDTFWFYDGCTIGAAVSLRHHLGRSLVSGPVAVQQPHFHGAAGAQRRPP